MERGRERAGAPSPESWSGGKGGHSPHLDTPGSGEGEAPLQVVRPLPEWWGLGYLGGGGPRFPGVSTVSWGVSRLSRAPPSALEHLEESSGCPSGTGEGVQVSRLCVRCPHGVLSGHGGGLRGLHGAHGASPWSPRSSGGFLHGLHVAHEGGPHGLQVGFSILKTQDVLGVHGGGAQDLKLGFSMVSMVLMGGP